MELKLEQPNVLSLHQIGGLNRAVEYICMNYGEPLQLEDIAKAARLERHELSRIFRDFLGATPIKWLWAYRTFLARRIIECTPYSKATDIAVYCGFSSSAHFSRLFVALNGVTPTKLQKSTSETKKPKADMTEKEKELIGYIKSFVNRALQQPLSKDVYYDSLLSI